MLVTQGEPGAFIGAIVIKVNSKCKGSYDPHSGDYGCGYHSTLGCDECKYGAAGGRKDPEAKCNQPKEKAPS